MKHSGGRRLAWSVDYFRVLILAVAAFFLSFAPVSAAETFDFAPVKAGSSQLFMITDTEHLTARARADEIRAKIHQILVDPKLDPHKIDTIVEVGGNPSVYLGNIRILTVSDRDARIFGKSKEHLAERWASILRSRLTQLGPIYVQSEAARHKGGAEDNSDAAKPLSEHRVLLFLLQVAVLLSMACICGEIMIRLGQPAVIGQLLAGILLGPSILGQLAPTVYVTLFPPESTQGYLLDIVSWLGVIFLLMLTGTETDIDLIKAQGRRAAATSAGGIILPFVLGFGVAFLLPESLLVLPNQRVILGAFIGTVFSMSSVAIIAKVLMDMNLMRRNVGQIILASALGQDVIGCVILAVVAALASATSGGEDSGGMMALIKVPVGMILFVGLGATIGRAWVLNSLRWIQDRTSLDFASISFVAVLLLVCSAITQFIGVHVVLGAFAVGVIIAQSPLIGERVLHPIEAVTMGIFAPIFFAAAGLHVNLTLLLEPEMLLFTVLITLFACIGKIAGSMLGGYIIHMDRWESISVGFGTNARGAMGLIVGILGFSLGILTVNMFSMIVIMSLATTAMTPALLKISLRKVTLSSDEQERLEREEKQSQSFVSKIKRVLVPIRPGSSRQLSSRLIAVLGEDHAIEATSLTLLSPSDNVESYVSETLAAGSKDSNVTLVQKVSTGEDSAEAILEEAGLNYDLLVIEPGKLAPGATLSDPFIARVARSAPCPMLIVRESESKPDWNVRRILIPTSGVAHTSKAVQLGILIAHGLGAEVTALCVVEERRTYTTTMMEDDIRREIVAREVVDQVAALAEAFSVNVRSRVAISTDPAAEILSLADESDIDLIVVGASVRPATHLHFGDTVQRLLAKARCHVAIVSP